VKTGLLSGLLLLLEPSGSFQGNDQNEEEEERDHDERHIANSGQQSLSHRFMLDNLWRETRGGTGSMFNSLSIKLKNIFQLFHKNPKIRNKIRTRCSCKVQTQWLGEGSRVYCLFHV